MKENAAFNFFLKKTFRKKSAHTFKTKFMNTVLRSFFFSEIAVSNIIDFGTFEKIYFQEFSQTSTKVKFHTIT